MKKLIRAADTWVWIRVSKCFRLPGSDYSQAKAK